MEAVTAAPSGEQHVARHVPMRTCSGCREVDAQTELLRAVSDANGRLQFRLGHRQAGRGTYVHRRKRCIEAALKGGFARSLRRTVQSGDVAALYQLAAVDDGSLPGAHRPTGSLKNQGNHS